MARDFNGSTDRIDYDNVFNTAGGGALSMSVLAYLDTVATDYRYLWMSHNSTNTGLAGIFLLGYVDATNRKLYFQHAGSTTLSRVSGNIAIAPLLGGWHHFCMTWDGSTTAANIHLYVDGTEVESYTQTTNGLTLTAGTGKWSLGGRIYDDTRNLDGKLAEAAAWSRVITTEEITNLAGFYTPDNYTTDLEFYASLEDGYTDAYGHSATADGTSDYTHPTVYPPSSGAKPAYLFYQM